MILPALMAGRFLLRIEDIDAGRSRTEHSLSIIADLKWLGLSWNDDIIYQSPRIAQYQAALARLREWALSIGAAAPAGILMRQ